MRPDPRTRRQAAAHRTTAQRSTNVVDVQVTWECFEQLRERYDRFALHRTPITSVMSEASMGKGSLHEMNIRTWREVQPELSPVLIGRILSTYYGGRSEVRLRRQIAEVQYFDFRSMYPPSARS